MAYKDPKQHNKLKARLHKERRDNAIQRLGGKCVQCGSVDNLELDHIDPSTKSFEISKSLVPLERYLEELAKCQLLCKPCHKKKTSLELKHPCGTRASYNHGGCRCQLCKDAEHQYYIKRRANKR